jgi:thiol:disulfide interchange protein
MDQDQSQAGQELTDDQGRTPEQVREEIEQTRADLGDTVASIAQKTDVKAQAKQAVDEAKITVTGKVSDVRETVTGKKDDLVSAAREATPESAGDAGQRATAFAQQNSPALIALAAFGLGLLIGRRRGR